MESAGQIGIELRLLTDKLKGDIAAAAKNVKKELSGVEVEAGGPKPSPVATPAKMEKVANFTKDLAEKLKDATAPAMQSMAEDNAAFIAKQMQWFRQQGAAPGPDTGAAPVSEAQAKKDAFVEEQMRWFRTQVGPTKIETKAPEVDTVGSLFEDLIKTKIGPIGKVIGAVTLALGVIRTVIGQVTWAFRMLLAPVAALTKFMVHQADEAAKFYAKSLQSGGLPIGFTARRQMLAEVIGVGENEVIAFTQAIRMLGEGMRMSTEYIVDAIPALTTISWEWKMVKLDIKALSMTIASDLVPAFHMLFTMLHVEIGKLTAVAKLMQLMPAFQQMKQMAALLGMKTAPPPDVSARRYPVSNWERLGLVLEGRGAGMEPAKVTANATKKTAENTGKLIGILMGMHAGGLFPTGVPVPSPSRP